MAWIVGLISVTSAWAQQGPQPVTLNGADRCQDAPLIGPGTYSGTLEGATPDGSSSCDRVFGANDVWYRIGPREPNQILFVEVMADQLSGLFSLHRSCPGTPANTIKCVFESDSGPARTQTQSLVDGGWVRVSSTGPSGC